MLLLKVSFLPSFSSFGNQTHMHFASANLTAFPSSSGSEWSPIPPHMDKQMKGGPLSSFPPMHNNAGPPLRTWDSTPNHAKAAALTALQEAVVGWEMIPEISGPIQEPVQVSW